jgi:hypothetical protein
MVYLVVVIPRINAAEQKGRFDAFAVGVVEP